MDAALHTAVTPAYTPVMTYATGTPTTSANGATVTVASVSFTSDGVTDWCYEAKWPGLWSTGATFYADMLLTVDGTVVDDMIVRNDSTVSTGAGGGVSRFYTQSGRGRPTAASHTLALQFSPTFGGSTTITMNLTGTRVAWVRASPVILV